MWGMFSQYISHHHLAVLLFVMPRKGEGRLFETIGLHCTLM